jgi:hypothetical protein
MVGRGLKIWALAELDGVRLALKRRFGGKDKAVPLPEPGVETPG